MDGKKVTTHLEEWTDQEKVTAAEQVKVLTEHPGWEYVVEAMSLYERSRLTNLVASPKDSISEYAHLTGFVKGLRELEGVAAGIIQAGKEVEDRRRAQELGGVRA